MGISVFMQSIKSTLSKKLLKKAWKFHLNQTQQRKGLDQRFPIEEEPMNISIYENQQKYDLLQTLLNENVSDSYKHTLASNYFESDLHTNIAAGGLLFDFFFRMD
jgi:hypothetical protein